MTTVTIGGGTYTVPLPLRPADEAAATPDERFTIALDAVDAELAGGVVRGASRAGGGGDGAVVGSGGAGDPAPAAGMTGPRNCYCGGPEEAVCGHRYGEGYYCRQKIQPSPQAGPDNVGDGDRWEDPRDTTGDQP